MDNREAWFKKVHLLIFMLIASAALLVSIFCFTGNKIYNGTLVLLSIPILLSPSLFYKIFHMKPVYSLNILTYIFITLAYTIGVALSGYNHVPFLDKFVHTLSGVFFTFIGLVVLSIIKKERNLDKKDFILISFFSVSFSMAIAAFWEIIEYSINFIAHNDPQKVLTTGVNDTMLDIIVCTAGSFFFLIPIYFYFFKHKTSFLMGIYKTITENNKKG